jgi:topoisomerase IA-like protein
MLGFTTFSIMKVMHGKDGKPNGITKEEAIEILIERRKKEQLRKNQASNVPEAVVKARKS